MLPRRDTDPRKILMQMAPTQSETILRQIGEGFDNVVYGVGERLVLRISKFATVDERREMAARDNRLHHLASRWSPLPVPGVLEMSPDEGALLMERIPGVGADVRAPRDPREFASIMAEFLHGLRRVPHTEMTGCVEPPPQTAARWLGETMDWYERAAHAIAAADRRLIETFLAGPIVADDARNTFCHNDLGDEHVLISDDGTVTGVIDWSDAVIGDPARDVALLLFDFGPRIGAAVAESCREDRTLFERARWWAGRAGIEGLAWRTIHDRPTAATLERLRATLCC